MAVYTLTLLDTVGIQDYVFGSNVLRENIGASDLVRRASRLWPFEEVRAMGRTNVKPGELTGDREDLKESMHIEDGNLDAEVVYGGGGNCAILFAERETARQFITNLHLRLVAYAPDLDLAAVHVQIDWKGDSLAGKEGEAHGQLAATKLERLSSMPLLGVGTTVRCRSTGLPAVGTDADEPGLKPKRAAPRPLSAAILAKLAAVEPANGYLKRLLPQLKREEANLSVPYDFDDLGREAGEISYIAVVHADGNGMGERINGLRASFCQDADDHGPINRRYIDTMRDFSEAVEAIARQALASLTDRLLRHWHMDKERIVGQAYDDHGQLVPLGRINLARDRENSRSFFPFRPIVFGGDDLTFVADGRLGLSLTAAYLELFEQAVEEQARRFPSAMPQLDGLKASAGVAVVKAHYPFARAYALAEELCRNAKTKCGRGTAAMDWHFAASGIFGGVKDIRARHYTVPAGRLEMRPVTIRPQAESWQAWPGLASAVKEFLLSTTWREKHNKVIALRQALRAGPETVARFRMAYELEKLPNLDGGPAELQAKGWDMERREPRCGYFDAVEALDFFLPLEG